MNPRIKRDLKNGAKKSTNAIKSSIDSNEVKHRDFLVQFVKKLEPRYWDESSGMIQDQYEEIFEVIFITKGSVGVGYRLFNEIFYGMRIVMQANKKIISPINDYSCINNKCSEFLYQPIDKIEAYGIRKENFNEIL